MKIKKYIKFIALIFSISLFICCAVFLFLKLEINGTKSSDSKVFLENAKRDNKVEMTVIDVKRIEHLDEDGYSLENFELFIKFENFSDEVQKLGLINTYTCLADEKGTGTGVRSTSQWDISIKPLNLHSNTEEIVLVLNKSEEIKVVELLPRKSKIITKSFTSLINHSLIKSRYRNFIFKKGQYKVKLILKLTAAGNKNFVGTLVSNEFIILI